MISSWINDCAVITNCRSEKLVLLLSREVFEQGANYLRGSLIEADVVQHACEGGNLAPRKKAKGRVTVFAVSPRLSRRQTRAEESLVGLTLRRQRWATEDCFSSYVFLSLSIFRQTVSLHCRRCLLRLPSFLDLFNTGIVNLRKRTFLFWLVTDVCIDKRIEL